MREEDWDDEYDDLGADDTIECYHCGANIYADADLCQQCGNFLIDSEAPVTSQPKWVLWTAILLIVMFLAAAVLPAVRLWTNGADGK